MVSPERRTLNKQGRKDSCSAAAEPFGTCLIKRWLKAGVSPDPRSIGTATRMEGPIGWPW
jgi:hypothetical protein